MNEAYLLFIYVEEKGTALLLAVVAIATVKSSLLLLLSFYCSCSCFCCCLRFTFQALQSPVSSLCCSFGSTIVAASRECLNASHSDREDGYIALRVVLLLQLLVALVVAVVVIAIVAAAVVSCIRNVHFRFRFALDFEFFVNTLISFFYFVEFCCFTFV